MTRGFGNRSASFPAVADSRMYGAMNNAPARADSPAPPAPRRKIASTTIAFFTRLSFSAPHDCVSASGHKRRDFSRPKGEADIQVSFAQSGRDAKHAEQSRNKANTSSP